MLLQDMLDDLRQSGVTLWIDDEGELCFRAVHPLTGEQRDGIRAHKAQIIALLSRANRAGAIPRAPRTGLMPASPAQQRFWFLAQLDRESDAYHVPVTLRLRGPLDVEALRAALDGLVARHETLRTTFVAIAGEPMQSIAPPDAGFPLALIDLTADPDREAALEAQASVEFSTPIDLAAGPIARGRLVRLAPREHALLITVHHIAADGWSIGIMMDELSAGYDAHRRGNAVPFAPLPLQYADFAVWQRARLTPAMLTEQRRYWQRQLADAPPLIDLPTDRKRTAERSPFAGEVRVALDERRTAALHAVSRHHGTTIFTTILTAWAIVLSRLSGQEDVVIGVPTADGRRAETEGLIGFFVNTLALRVDLSGNPSMRQLLARVNATVLDGQRHQDLPYEQVVDLVQPTRDATYHPIFQTTFTWQPNNASGFRLGDLDVDAIRIARGATKFDLTLGLAETDGRIIGGIAFSPRLFDAATIERFAAYLLAALAAMGAGPDAPVSAIDLLPPDERRRLAMAPNGAAISEPTLCLHEMFSHRAAARPEAVAVVCAGEALSYGELEARSAAVAGYLRGLGVGADDRVAICMERSVEMIVGLLAILKAGAGYVPLDPGYPADRLAFMLEDAAPGLVLTHAAARGALAAALAGLAAPPVVIDLDADAARWAGRAGGAPAAAARVAPHHLAYVIYTSGSTGRPKGVMIEHRNVVRLFAATAGTFAFGADDVWASFHSISFDFSVWEIWGALLHGGRLVIVPRAVSRSPGDFHALLRRERVTVLNQTPSAFRGLIAAREEAGGDHDVRVVVLGGEALEPAMLAPWFADPANAASRVVNMYGITETTVHVTHHQVTAEDVRVAGRSPIGRAIDDQQVHVLDRFLDPAPVGVAGEMYVGGAGNARGYVRRPGLTAARFVPHPFRPGERLYRTGDLARVRADGIIEYLGRNDQQVKIRGFRIETGEIESRLLQHHAVSAAVVRATTDRQAQKTLVAYVVRKPGVHVDVAALHGELAASLPDYMRPGAYVQLDAIPLNRNGKVADDVLPAPGEGAYVRATYEAPADATEECVARIWSEVLGIHQIGRQDNFFMLGGHSLMAVRMVARLSGELGIDVALTDVFEVPTLQAFASRIR